LAEQLAHVDVPTTVVLGGADTIVPPEQSRAVAEAARRLQELVVVSGAGHNDSALLDGDQLVDAVVDLARRTAEFVEPDD
jgi:pimeloyl-ACP methyl ester carboxylesterase